MGILRKTPTPPPPTPPRHTHTHTNSRYSMKCAPTTPSYLSDIVTQTVSSVSRYNPRNSHDLQIVDARFNNYYYPFLPSIEREWNNLPSDNIHLESIASFKHNISRPRWLSWMRRPTGDQAVAGSTSTEVGNILSWRLILKYFLWSFSPFRWFQKGSCQFLAKECAQHWLTA